MALTNRQRGTIGEELAAEYLMNKGYQILERNYRFEHGEIDLIAQDGEELVFVEVKSRKSKSFGEPEESITEVKEGRLRDAAEGYLYEKDIENRTCRFDVVAVEFLDGIVKIRHTVDAF
ncbi:MAG: YraN family protein [Ignavibacteriales bacterium]|nr:YraN family protein [Ignavibacteriales bacterium]